VDVNEFDGDQCKEIAETHGKGRYGERNKVYHDNQSYSVQHSAFSVQRSAFIIHNS
jgi:hypothetical protein